MDWLEIIFWVLLGVWATGSLCFMVADGIKNLKRMKELQNMAQYPTPKSTYADYKEAVHKVEHMKDWIETVYPEVFKEWKAVYDVERSVKDE